MKSCEWNLVAFLIVFFDSTRHGIFEIVPDNSFILNFVSLAVELEHRFDSHLLDSYYKTLTKHFRDYVFYIEKSNLTKSNFLGYTLMW